MLPRKVSLMRVSQESLFNAISCVLVWVFMHGASDKLKENIKNILFSETKHEQEGCPTLK